MHHFFLPPQNITPTQVIFPEAIARQISQVLRLKPNQSVVVLDNEENACLVNLVEVNGKQVTGEVVETCYSLPPEPEIKLTLYISLTQREKFELILQKCTELGISRFVPVIFSRSLVQSVSEAEEKRERWQAILREAAEQCGRLRIPNLGPVLKWKDAIKHAAQNHPASLVMWEGEQHNDLGDVFAAICNEFSLAFFIGPEGGISHEEMALFQSEDITPISLGPRILRMDTAAIAATAILMEYYGAMRPAESDESNGESLPF